MESLFFKIVCIGFFITCITVFYEEVVEFVQFKAYGNPYWLNVSQLGECSCDGGKTRNCYPHSDDSQLCGKCFETCPEVTTELPIEQKRSDDLVFGLSASMSDVNRLLVLIASIHRNFPTTKLIIFDHANGVRSVSVISPEVYHVEVILCQGKPSNPVNFLDNTSLENQLISIRNVEVVNFKNRGDGRSSSVPFYLKEILKHHSNVLWLTHDLEILNTKLMQAGPFRRSSKFAVTYISHDKRRKVTSYGYRPYFPSSLMSHRFPMAVLLKNDAGTLIRWVEKCALTPECWKCDTMSGAIEDCTWMVLQQVASDAQQLRFLGDTTGTINQQTWGPPECDFYCTMWLIGITIVALISFVILALVLLQKTTKKTK